MHDPTKVLLGSHGSSALLAEIENSDPASFPAGLAVRRSSTGALSLTSGSLIGISLGRSLSDHSFTSVARSGSLIPVLLAPDTEAAEGAELDFVVIGSLAEFDTDGKACVDGTATQAIYVSGPIKGIDPVTKAEVDCALVDFPGGL